ncbi:hypothetical protein P9597_16640 [Aneurinibacillus migulanus]|uniref:hypothetical protein n=1 Tax=Aneurinibacillus migulanus TaxID=47500 RepID=UPI002E1CD6D0|nr:hypothetical protein [Aneurinibacillus migulanus]
MKKVATAFLAISLLATTPVFAAEQESNPIQQEEEMTEQGKDFSFKDLTVDEIMAQKGMKSALESFYNKFPRTKAYKIEGSKIQRIENGEEESEIQLSLIDDEKGAFVLYFDTKAEKITKYIQIEENIPESELPSKVQASLDKIHNLSSEVKNLKVYRSSIYFSTIKEREHLNQYSFGFNESGKVEEEKTNDKEFAITFDQTGKVRYFFFEKIPLVDLEGNTKEEKAQDLLKRLYGEEANEYKIEKVNEFSKDDLDDENFDSRRGNIVFMSTSSEKEPIVVHFNSKNELIGCGITSQVFLEEAGFLQ